jgi:hypothetical protein
MKKLRLQNTALPAILLSISISALSYTSTALAQKTIGVLGAKATAVDVYTSTCSKKTIAGVATPTNAFITRIRGIKGALVNVQIKKGTKVAKATDTKNADALFGSFASIKGSGEGVYTITVDKRAAGITNYEIQTFCDTAIKDTTSVSGFKHSKQTGPLATQNQ